MPLRLSLARHSTCAPLGELAVVVVLGLAGPRVVSGALGFVSSIGSRAAVGFKNRSGRATAFSLSVASARAVVVADEEAIVEDGPIRPAVSARTYGNQWCR